MLTAYCEIRKNILVARPANAAANKRKTAREEIHARSGRSEAFGEMALCCAVVIAAFPKSVAAISDSFDRSQQTLFAVADSSWLGSPNDRRRDCRRRQCPPEYSCPSRRRRSNQRCGCPRPTAYPRNPATAHRRHTEAWPTRLRGSSHPA